MCDFGFYTRIEGLLGEGTYIPKILFLLREPHEKRAEIFWFKEEVVQVKCDLNATKKTNRTGTRYYNIFSILAKHILKTEDASILKKCAYMNLRPDGGERERSKEYYQVLAAFAELSFHEKCNPSITLDEIDWSQTETAKKVAQNRMHIIQNAIAQKVKYIVTTPDIYEAIRKSVKTTEGKLEEKTYQWERLDKGYNYCQIEETTILAFPHPSWPRISHEDLEILKKVEF